MNNIPYIDILILAMIAIFIINRLKNVLGKKTGNEQDIVEKFSRNKTIENLSRSKMISISPLEMEVITKNRTTKKQ